jgi:uncharacterized protein (DUF488 family)
MIEPVRIFTIGHSTHPIERFIELLRAGGVEALADVRRYPGSRRNPQFGAQALARALDEAGIDYRPLGETLGGRRSRRRGTDAGTPVRDNSAWRNPSFRAYADHMARPEFAAGLAELSELAAATPTAVMCAEGHPSRCHRQLIADALTVVGWEVIHLLPDGGRAEHELNPHAVVEGGTVAYPARAEPTLPGMPT